MGKIFEAIPKIMSEVGAIEKTRTNTQGAGYKFRGIDDVYLALQPVLHKHSVFFVPTVLETTREERTSKSGGNLFYTILKVKYTFFADDGSSFDSVVVGEAMDSGDKSSNKAMSAALKVCALQLFCIPTEEEKDTEYDSPEIKPKEKTYVTPNSIRGSSHYPETSGPSDQAPKPQAKIQTHPVQPVSSGQAGVVKMVGQTERELLVELCRDRKWSMIDAAKLIREQFGVEQVTQLNLSQFQDLYDYINTSALKQHVKGVNT